ncbi:MAG: prepilin-type N-terminal cleavage/methylation domain-containing protein [Burkholderiaceae bacterium]
MRKTAGKTGGFTLIELMVAISIMALLAILSWRGLDGMTRVQSQTQAKTDGVLALQAGLAQWQTDLDALTQLPQITGAGNIGDALDYDGQVLRLIRRYAENQTPASNGTNGTLATESIRVVAWSQRNIEGKSRWLRWQSPAVRTRAELQAAWVEAAQWSQNPSDADKKRETTVAEIDKWQIYYYRNNAWSNAQSSADMNALIPGSKAAALPDGVRLVLTLSSDQALVGNITRDWIRPTVGGGK